MLILVFGTPTCKATRATRDRLHTLALPYRYCDIADDQDAREYVHTTLGHRDTPVVIVGDLMHWAGHHPDMINILAPLKNQHPDKDPGNSQIKAF